jgi:hypothetical protein
LLVKNHFQERGDFKLTYILQAKYKWTAGRCKKEGRRLFLGRKK